MQTLNSFEKIFNASGKIISTTLLLLATGLASSVAYSESTPPPKNCLLLILK
jgi:hypothetical protein